MRELQCPFALQTRPTHQTKGFYPEQYPMGAVVHYSAGSSASAALNVANQKGYAYWVIDVDGAIHQTHRLDVWGPHAGQSFWPSLGQDVSRFLLGIEVVCPGRLTWVGKDRFETWYKKAVPTELVREFKADEANVAAGAYQVMSYLQENALEKLLQWLAKQASGHFEFDLVLGHDEVAPDRKDDPGGSLSWTMPEFRAHLKRRAQAFWF